MFDELAEFRKQLIELAYLSKPEKTSEEERIVLKIRTKHIFEAQKFMGTPDSANHVLEWIKTKDLDTYFKSSLVGVDFDLHGYGLIKPFQYIIYNERLSGIKFFSVDEDFFDSVYDIC